MPVQSLHMLTFAGPMNPQKNVMQLFFYVADEGGDALGLGWGTKSVPNSILAFGSRDDVGNWELHLESKVVSFT